jgi:hypothetical protein
VDHPNIDANFESIDRAKGITTMPQGDLEHAAVNSLEGLDLPPSAAVVSASSMSLCTSPGNSSKSLRATLIHEIRLLSLIR